MTWKVPVSFDEPVATREDKPPIDYGFFYRLFDSNFYQLGTTTTAPWFTVPDKAWNVLGMSFFITTGANVGNRIFQLEFRDANDNRIWEGLQSPQVAASSLFLARAVPGVNSDDGYLTGATNARRCLNIGLPNPFPLFAGSRFRIVDLNNIETTDVAQIKVYYRREVF